MQRLRDFMSMIILTGSPENAEVQVATWCHAAYVARHVERLTKLGPPIVIVPCIRGGHESRNDICKPEQIGCLPEVQDQAMVR